MATSTEITDSLEFMRESRDASKRLAQRLVDEAKLLRLEADLKVAQSKVITDEINENVPVPYDK